MHEELTDKSVKTFLDELSSSSPAPGGGSVAAFVPMRVAEACVAVMDLCHPVAEKKNVLWAARRQVG